MRIDRFEVIEHLGQGGFADVFAAFDPSFESVVAVKVLRPDVARDPDVRRRFRDEAVLLRRVQAERPCQHLVTVHEIGEFEDRPFLVLTYCRGGTVADRLRSIPSPEVPDRLRLAAVVCDALTDALTALHGAGVVHRDVKPSNLLLRRAADAPPPSGLIATDETVLLADLGLAKDLMDSDSALSLAGGTIGFMAPEQLEHGAVPTPATDLYAATTVMAVILTGERPQGSWRGRLSAHGYDPSLVEVIERGTARHPGDRFQCARDWGEGVVAELARLDDRPPPDRGASRRRPTAEIESGPGAPTGPGPRPRGATTPGAMTPGSTTPTVAEPDRRTAPPTRRGAGPPPGPDDRSIMTSRPTRWRWPVVAMAVVAVVALAVVAGAVALTVARLGEAADPGGADGPAAPSSTLAPAAGGTEEPDESATTASAPSTGGEAGSTGSAGGAAALAAALLVGDDVGDTALVLEERSAESGGDPDHPLASYDFCGDPPDLSAIGPGANRVLTTDLLAADALIVSSVSRASSPTSARAVVDRLVAAAADCGTYTDGATQVTILSATETDEGGEILVRLGSGLGPDSDYTVVFTVVEELVTALEVGSDSGDVDRLQSLLVARATALVP